MPQTVKLDKEFYSYKYAKENRRRGGKNKQMNFSREMESLTKDLMDIPELKCIIPEFKNLLGGIHL